MLLEGSSGAATGRLTARTGPATWLFDDVSIPADAVGRLGPGDRDADAAPPPGRIARGRGSQLLLLFDAGGMMLSFAIGIGVLGLGVGAGTVEPGGHVGAWVLAFVPLYLCAFGAYGVYRRERRRLFATNFPDLVYIAHGLFAGGAAMMAISHLLRRTAGLHPTISLTGAVGLTVPAFVAVPLARVLGGLLVRRRGLVRSRVIVLGSGVVADSVVRRLDSVEDIELLGCVDDPGAYVDDRPRGPHLTLLGTVSELPALCSLLDADRVIVAFSPTSAHELADTLRGLPPRVQVSVVPRLFELLTWRSHVDELHGLPVMDVAPPVLGPAHRALKRSIDLVASLGAVFLLAPAWAVIAVLIKLTSPGPVLFRQLRTGRGERPFCIYKFRTMRVGADDEKPLLLSVNEVDGPLFKMRDDPRVTRIGRLLRATSIDELPQLLNVIRGEMSLVGPRPFVVDEAGRIEGWAARRFDVRPGMTGIWQVSGRNDLPFEELRRLDYAYVASWSLWWDLKIIWQTPATVFRRRGAY